MHSRTITARGLLAGCAALLFAVTACSRSLQQVQLAGGERPSIAELWQEPTDLTQRDLVNGPGGQALAPGDAPFEFVARDTSGYSPGFDVRGPNGTAWSVKLGPEAQSEVVSSRILWAIGFHQPATYYVPQWTLTGDVSGAQPAARFRRTVAGQDVVGEWSWYENPFVGSREFGGLVVANVILANWDWKTSNNKIYQLSSSVNGVSRWFVVRDLGASLGKFTYPPLLRWFRLRGFGQGTRNDLPGFESQGFIERIDGTRVVFDYRGIYRDVIDAVRPADVRWACTLLARLTDQQWRDAFRGAGYNSEQSVRYIAKIKAKIAQGLQLTG